MKPLVILVTGEPVPPVLAARGTFERHIRETIGAAWPGAWLIVDARVESPPAPGDAAGIIITGSPASVTERRPWMLKAAAWLRQVVGAGRPVLGLCFGHQLLAEALGGEVRRHQAGPENGTVPLELLAPDDLFGPLPASTPFVNMMHDDTVARLPSGAVVLARTAHEPHAALRFGVNAWGLQFHPEFDGGIVRGYVNHNSDKLLSVGRDPEAILDAVADTPWSAALLRRFAAKTAAIEPR